MRERHDEDDEEERPGLVIGPSESGPDVTLSGTAGPVRSPHSDDDLRDEIRARLDASSLADDDVEVIVRARDVTLHGTVADEAARHLAEHIAESVTGVRHVSTYLRTRRSGA